jgi:ATP synthase protein I
MTREKKKSNQKKNLAGLNKFIRYSTIAFEMGAIIGGGTYAGVWLDKKIEMNFPVFTVVLSLFSVFFSTYLIIKQIFNDK